MRPGLAVAAWLSLTAAVFAQAKPAPVSGPVQRSISASKQFVIYFSDGAVRGRLARMAEDCKEEWLRSLAISKDEWKAPIIIQVVSTRPPNAPAIATNLYLSDGGEMKVQIDIYDLTVMKGPELPLEIYRALCLEYMHRESPPKAGKAFSQPPAWLVEGMYENVVSREEGIPAGLFEMLVKSGPPPKIEIFLKMRPERMDATSRAVYRAQAMGLLRAFLSVQGGSKGLADYLASLGGRNPHDPDPLLEKFPLFGSQPGELSKVWTLSLANASAADRMKPLGMAETRRQLGLLFEISAPKDPKKPAGEIVKGPEAMQAIARGDSGRYTLQQKAEDLLRLEMRAHPIMRPIVGEYRLIASELAARPGKNLEKRIRKNMELQVSIADRTKEIEDYMNWFEATQLNTPSREFEGVTSGSKSMEFKRTDPVSRLLDDYEARGW